MRADLRDAVPSDVYMAVYARHNPERDYQRAYGKEVWKAVEETKIVDRAIKIFTDRAAQDNWRRWTGRRWEIAASLCTPRPWTRAGVPTIR